MVNSVCKNSAHKLGLNFVGEIEQLIFFAQTLCLFAYRTKFGEIDPRAQFHQRSTYSF